MVATTSSCPSRRSRRRARSTGPAARCSRAGWSRCCSASARRRPGAGARPKTLGLLVLAAVLGVAWVRNERAPREPLVDMQMMRRRGVWTVNATAVLLGAGHVLVVRAHPAVRGDAGLDGLRLRRLGHRRGPVPAARDDRHAAGQPARRPPGSTVGSRVPLLLGASITTAASRLLAVAHSEPFEVYLAAALMGVGIGFAFAAMANLIVEAVRPEETGVATGMNTVMRSIGGAVGGQIGASVLAANVAADGADDRARLHASPSRWPPARCWSPSSPRSRCRARSEPPRSRSARPPSRERRPGRARAHRGGPRAAGRRLRPARRPRARARVDGRPHRLGARGGRRSSAT